MIVYILHEYGSNSHYNGLEHLLKNNSGTIKYREFSIFKKIIKSILKVDIKLLKKQLTNIYFLLNLLVTKNKKIVLGIAPYDFRLFFLAMALKNHTVYYHTSWTCWDRTYFPKKFFVNSYFITKWENFIKFNTQNIFSVTDYTKSQIIENLNINKDKIKVVNHSFDSNIFKFIDRSIELKFLYVGRLDNQKGILELLDLFSKISNVTLSIVGDGILLNKVKKYAKDFLNINYLGYISEKEKLVEIYNEHSFLLLNSKKQKNWEELFGMVIIEAMACGLVPIATNHKGPREIISNLLNGYIFNEEDFIKNLDKMISNVEYDKIAYMRNNALIRATDFTVENISLKWEPILE